MNKRHIQYRYVGIDKIVEIYHQVSEKDKEYYHFTKVLCNNLSMLAEYIETGDETKKIKRKKLLIEKEEDIALVAGEMINGVKRYVLPYLEENKSLDRLNVILNAHPEQTTVHNFVYPFRVMMGLIAAKLVNNPDFDKLVAIYDKEMAEVAEDSRREYQKLKQLLSGIPPYILYAP